MSQLAQNTKKNTVYYVLCILCILLMFLGGFIPSFAPEITVAGMQILAIYVALIILWSTIGGVLWPSILAIVALGISEYTNINGAITSALGQNVIWQILFAIALTQGLSATGAGEFIAKWFISRKFLTGRPYLFTWILFLVFAVLGAISSAIGMILLSWTILNSIADHVGVKNSERYFRIMSIFMVVNTCIGEQIIIYKNWPMGLWTAFGKMASMELDYIPFMVIAAVISLFFTVVLTLIIKIARVDVSFLKTFDNTKIRESMANERMNKVQIGFLVTLLACIVFSLGTSIFPRGSLLYTFCNKVSPAGAFAVAVAALIFLKNKEGKPVLDFPKVMGSSPFWSAFMICAASIPLANALCNEATGFTAWISRVLTPVFQNSSLWVIYFIIIFVTLVLTNIASCSGVGFMMLPIAVPLATAAGANMYLVGICTIYTCLFGFILPGSSGLSAMMYGMKEKQSLTVKEILIYTSIPCLIFLIIACIGFPLLDMSGIFG